MKGNILYENFKNGIYTIAELKNLCTKRSGCGVVFRAPVDLSSDGDLVYEDFTVFFSIFLDAPTEMMFWKEGYEPGNRLTHLKRIMTNHKDPLRLGALALIFKDELY